jgi:hypothetical protein
MVNLKFLFTFQPTKLFAAFISDDVPVTFNASSIEWDDEEDFVPRNAVDGKFTEGWDAGFFFTQFYLKDAGLEITFEVEKEIKGVKLLNR